MSESYIEIELTQQPIELYKLLKIADLVSGGGEAKVVISEGYVLLNGDVEYRKRKKIYHEDVIEFNGEIIQLIINDLPSDNESVLEADKLENRTEPLSVASNKEPIRNIEKPREPKKRKPISF